MNKLFWALSLTPGLASFYSFYRVQYFFKNKLFYIKEKNEIWKEASNCWGKVIWKLLLNKINTKLISQEALSVKRCLFRCTAGDKYSFSMEITTVELPVCDLRSLFWLWNLSLIDILPSSSIVKSKKTLLLLHMGPRLHTWIGGFGKQRKPMPLQICSFAAQL